MPVPAWKIETAVVQHAHHLCDTAQLQKKLKDKTEPVLNRHVGIFQHNAGGIAHKPDWQGERELPALGLGDEAGGQAAADRMQLQFGDCALEAQQQTPVGAPGIVDAVAIGDQTAPQPANIQQGMSVMKSLIC